MSTGPQIGVTLYSFTEQYHSGEYTFEELIRKVGDRGLGTGLEIVGFQSIRGYPEVSDSFALRFKRLLDEAGLVPSALGANIDAGRRRDRRMTHEETVETLSAQIRAAEKLGFRVMRVQYGAAPDALEAVLPLAEGADVKLGMEIHAPHTVDHPTMVALRERIERLGSPYLGFIPDFGASMDAIPPGHLAHWRELSSTTDLIDSTVAGWERAHRGESDPFDERRAAIERAAEMGSGPAANLALLTMTLFGHQPAAKWAEIMHQVVHVHAKFYEIDDAGNEPSIDYGELMRTFRDGGYEGYLSSEWEGSSFDRAADPFDLVERQQRLMRRHLEANPAVDSATSAPGGRT